ncbi:MAG TPA: gas vesicle protein GvpJ [Solirubrobacteraceae bacterium]|nr:gas vesicle protein GvpJ [Solirubrobacteraceae bacterium]
MAMQPIGGGALERKQETSGLADVVGTILDKGVVIDVFARVSLVGIEILRVDARVVVASVDTYLRFAEAANRLELGAREPEGLSDLVGDITQAGARGIAQGKAKGAVDAGFDRLGGLLKPPQREHSTQRR